jgi:hypothetical protein
MPLLAEGSDTCLQNLLKNWDNHEENPLIKVYYKHIPTFYGVPKIHKKPWKARPIMPCHSTILAPFAKVLSKLLKC